MSPNACCIKGCDTKVLAAGLCSKHWRRNRLYGSPIATKMHSATFVGQPASDRFLSRIRKTDTCWWWLGCRDRQGYGLFKGDVGGMTFRRAHRFSYALATGDLLVGAVVMHSCDNPSCVNPAHLSSGTHAENQRDKAQKGRSRSPEGASNHRAVLTEEQAQAILLDARPYAEIAADYGVKATTVGSLKQRHTWRNLRGDAAKAVRTGQQGTKCYKAILSDNDVRYIRNSADRGMDLATRYRVSRQTITDIRKGRSWKHLL